MIYRHQYFIINKDRGSVYDENGKELRLTGNAFRVLVFLCEKSSANLTELGDHLDWVKDYSENHMRQYRYKINTVIGYDIIKYKNGIYSLIGEVEKCEKIEEDKRNTDLLHTDSVESENNKKNIMSEIKRIDFNKSPAIITAVLLLLTFFSWPYGYYSFLRIVVTATAIYYSYYIYEHSLVEELNIWFWGLISLVILFNPIFPIYFSKSIWGIFDIFAAVFILGFIYNKKLTNVI